MKFSIIVPVYNVEDYIIKCLDSIYNQTYKNYEVIIVNDGSTDHSLTKIQDFCHKKKNFFLFNKTNGGLSDARNYGLKKATGDYLLFIDSDDYIEKDLLAKINEAISQDKPDILRLALNKIANKEKVKIASTPFRLKRASEAIMTILKDSFVEAAWLYCFKKEFWLEHDFNFTKGKIHEDFGLIPLVLMEAETISCLNYAGYNYVVRSNSLSTSKEKKWQKFNDYLYFFKNNLKKIDNCDNINMKCKKYLKSYYANGVLSKVKTLDNDKLSQAKKLIKEANVSSFLVADTWMRKLKKLIYKLKY